jgi:hypothetical protein
MSFFSSQSVNGYNGAFYVSPDGGTTWQPVGELRNVTLNMKVDALDATSHSSGGHKNPSAWSRRVGCDGRGSTIFADAGQAAIMAALTAKTRIKFRFDPAGSATGKPRREGFGFFSSLSEKQPTAELESRISTSPATASWRSRRSNRFDGRQSPPEGCCEWMGGSRKLSPDFQKRGVTRCR